MKHALNSREGAEPAAISALEPVALLSFRAEEPAPDLIRGEESRT